MTLHFRPQLKRENYPILYPDHYLPPPPPPPAHILPKTDIYENCTTWPKGRKKNTKNANNFNFSSGHICPCQQPNRVVRFWGGGADNPDPWVRLQWSTNEETPRRIRNQEQRRHMLKTIGLERPQLMRSLSTPQESSEESQVIGRRESPPHKQQLLGFGNRRMFYIDR